MNILIIAYLTCVTIGVLISVFQIVWTTSQDYKKLSELLSKSAEKHNQLWQRAPWFRRSSHVFLLIIFALGIWLGCFSPKIGSTIYWVGVSFISIPALINIPAFIYMIFFHRPSPNGVIDNQDRN